MYERRSLKIIYFRLAIALLTTIFCILPASICFSVDLPSTFDWRTSPNGNAVTPVRNQGSCGSCWAFAVTAAIESQILLSQGWYGLDLDLSEQILISCGGVDVGSCAGGWPYLASEFLAFTGTNIESSYPYIEADGSCSSADTYWQIGAFKFDSWGATGGNYTSVDAIKNSIFYSGPVAVWFEIYTDFYDYTGGVYAHTYGFPDGAHVVLVVGWDDVAGAFIVKNSWGADWGESGYFRIAYSEVTSDAKFGYGFMGHYNGASFQCPSLPARNVESGGSYLYLSDAVANAQDGQTIQIQAAHHFDQTLSADNDIAVILRGGYDCGYSVSNSNASFISSITINSGALTIDRIVLQ